MIWNQLEANLIKDPEMVQDLVRGEQNEANCGLFYKLDLS